LIVPANIPGDDLQPTKLEQVASSLRAAGTSSLTQAEVAERSWAGLPAVLESPQGPTIYGALGTPTEVASAIEGKFDRVSDALDEFAAALRSIKQTFAAIKADAVAFRNTITADERVWVSPSETKEYEFDSQARVAASRGYVRTSDEVLEYLRGRGERARLSGGRVRILVHWTQSSEHIDQNNALMDRLADAYTRLQNAEADCANAINRQRDLCVAEVEHIEAWQLKQSGENTVVLPWGSRVDEDRNCGESFWWGAGNAGKEALVGAGGLIGYNGTRNDWSWDQVGQSWLGAVQGLGSLLVITSPPLLALGLAGVPVLKEGATMGGEMIKGLLAWDTWAENPAEASGRVLVNIGSLFIPGAGEVAAAIKALSAGSRIVDLAGDAARLTEAAAGGLNKLDNLLPHLDSIAGDVVGTGAKVDDLVTVGGRIDMPDSDLLHVGSKTDAPSTPSSFFDDSPAGPKPHSDDSPAPTHDHDASAPPPRADDTTGPPTHSGDGEGPGGSQTGAGDGTAREPGHPADGDTPPVGATDDPGTGGSPSDLSTSPPSVRVYEMMDGQPHSTTHAPDQLGTSRVTDRILLDNGVSRQEFIHILNKPLDTLDARDFSILRDVRNDLPPLTPDTVFQKVMDQPWIDSSGKIHVGAGDDMVMKNKLQVKGSVTVADDTAHLGTPQALYDGLRLDYPGTHFAPDDSSSFVMRFRVDDPAAITPSLHSRFGGDGSQDAWKAPFTGNGFLGADDIIPEYKASTGADIRSGAEMWEILPDGTQRLYAVLRGTEWIPQG
jgi:hypothetical protein